jgi:ankyrin repeat protein
MHQAPLEIINFLLRQWNDSIHKVIESNGCIPLHLACDRQAPEDVIRHLISMWPESIHCTTKDGRLPIHLILSKNTSQLSLVKFMVEPNPESLVVKDDNGWIAFHCAVAYGSFEVLEDCIRSWRNGCMERGRKGRIALHIVCLRQRSLPYVQCVHRQWKHAVRQRDKNGLLPIQVACEVGAPLDVIRYLIDEWPASLSEISAEYGDMVESSVQVQQINWSRDQDIPIAGRRVGTAKNNKGRKFVPPSPIVAAGQQQQQQQQILIPPPPSRDVSSQGHERMQENSFEFHIQSVDAYKSSSRNTLPSEYAQEPSLSVEEGSATTTGRGAGLHKACEAPQSLPVIEALLQECPEAVSFMTCNGNLPIHTACLNQALPEILQLLVTYSPNSVATRDQYGNLPLHLASFSGASFQSVRFLVQQYPEAINQRNSLGETPLDRAKNPFFDALDTSVIEFLETCSSIPPSHLHFSDSALPAAIRSDSNQYPSPRQRTSLSAPRPFFSKPLDVEETRKTLELLRASRAASKSSLIYNDESMNQRFSSDRSNESIKEEVSFVPVSPPLQRQVASAYAVPDREIDVGVGIATKDDPITVCSRTSLTVHDLSSNIPATSTGGDDRRIAGQQQTYSSFYQSALASSTVESPPSASRPSISPESQNDDNDGFITLSSVSGAIGAPYVYNNDSDQTSSILLSPARRRNQANSDEVDPVMKRPGVVMVNEPAIHPNSAMYRAAYGGNR